MNTEDLIKKYYYNPKTGFTSAANLYKVIKEKHQGITLRSIKDFINRQQTHQIHTNKKIPLTEYNQIVVNGVGTWQIDLLDLSNYRSSNEGYRYIFMMIDVYSRFYFVEPLKAKTASECLLAFKKIEYAIESDGYKVGVLEMDKGVEFNGIVKTMKPDRVFFKKPNTHTLTSIVERRNRTLRERLERYLTANGTLDWINVIQQLNNNINNSVNRSMKHTPSSIYQRKEKNDMDIREPPTELMIGQKVLILEPHKDIQKKSTGRYSSVVYTIAKKDGLGYRLNGKQGNFFNYQLLPINTSENTSIRDTNELRRINKRNNTIKRRINQELN